MSPRIRLIAALVALALIAYALASQPSHVTESFGYSPDPAGAAAYNATLPHPSFATAAPEAMAKAVPANVFLWRQMDAAHRARYGTKFEPSSQKIGAGKPKSKAMQPLDVLLDIAVRPSGALSLF